MATFPVTTATFAVNLPALLIEPDTVKSLPVLMTPVMRAFPPTVIPFDVDND